MEYLVYCESAVMLETILLLDITKGIRNYQRNKEIYAISFYLKKVP